MFNFKASSIAAGAAFILSLLVGAISGVGFLMLILRAFIFAVAFFGFTCLVFWLLAQFMPELLSGGEDDLGFPVSGSRVDISLGDESVTGAFPSDNSELIDDIAGRPSTSAKAASPLLDQDGNAGYNDEGEVDGELEFVDDGQILGTGSGMSGRREDTLPDMDSLTEASSGNTADAINTDDIGFNSSGPVRPKSSSKKADMAGDFNPKELAQAIQTVLKRDEKG